MDAVGRRRLLLAAALPFLAGALWQRFATSFWELLSSVLLASFGVGLSQPVIPVYMVEIAEDRVRGALVSLPYLMSGAGALLMMIVASRVSFFTTTEFMMGFPVVFVAAFWWMPESPYYLVAKHRPEEATEALMRLRGKESPQEVRAELEAIRKSVEQRARDHISAADAFRELRRNAGARRAVAVVMVFTTLVVLTGCGTMGVYSTHIFAETGGWLDAATSATVLCGVQVAFSVVSTLLVDRVGRRPLLLACFSGCAVSVALVGVYFYLQDHGSAEVEASLSWLPLAALLAFYIAYDLGGNALLWVLPNELVPASARALCNASVGVLLSVLTFGVTKLFQVVTDAAGSYVPFWFFSGCSAAGVVFTWFFIPETKGRPLEDISAEMSAMAAGQRRSKRKPSQVACEASP